jgi:hypothetical protein
MGCYPDLSNHLFGNMSHTKLRKGMGLAFIGVGAFCLVFGVVLGSQLFARWRLASGVVELRPSPDRPTELRREVRYTRANGVETTVPFPEETLPASARPGEHVRVAYIPDSKTSMVCTFRSAWGASALAGSLGLVSSALGFFLYARRTDVVIESHAQIAEPGGSSQ